MAVVENNVVMVSVSSSINRKALSSNVSDVVSRSTVEVHVLLMLTSVVSDSSIGVVAVASIVGHSHVSVGI